MLFSCNNHHLWPCRTITLLCMRSLSIAKSSRKRTPVQMDKRQEVSRVPTRAAVSKIMAKMATAPRQLANLLHSPLSRSYSSTRRHLRIIIQEHLQQHTAVVNCSHTRWSRLITSHLCSKTLSQKKKIAKQSIQVILLTLLHKWTSSQQWRRIKHLDSNN